MPTKTWKAVERRIAAAFGCRRQRLSGSSGRDDETCSDTTHPDLFIEIKYRQKHAVRTLYDATLKLAASEGKTPVVVLVDKGRQGFLVCCHSDDIVAVADVVSRAANKGESHGS